uniref:Reverse transcriptase domain-containing protein n=1 Tax=Tanacetum cinerariifolium TaxID=118510 RepID=A0A699HIU8_TANCI|nr:reverse transcriptase domain-containing protein [Tanacetum cinerariifolium]
MLHEPCEKDARYAPCNVEGTCSEHVPKAFYAETVIDENGCLIYRWRDNKMSVKKGNRHGLSKKQVYGRNGKDLFIKDYHLKAMIRTKDCTCRCFFGRENCLQQICYSIGAIGKQHMWHKAEHALSGANGRSLAHHLCMSTRSNSSHLFSLLRDPESLIRRRNLGEPSSLFDFEEVMNNNQNQDPPPQKGPPPMVRPNGQAPRMMEELCQPSINGWGEPIAPIPIQATDFGLRHHTIQQVQNTCQFHRLPGDDANRHIDKFLKITQHMKQNGVSDDALRLSLFSYSLTHHAIAWYDRLPRNSIHSFDDMMRKFLSKYFPPSMDTINATTGGTFMQKTSEECYELIKNMTAHHNHWDTSTIRDETSRNISSTSTTETVGGYTQETAYATTGNYNSGGNSYQPQGDHNLLSYRSNNYLGPPDFNKPNVQNRFNQNQNQSYNPNQGNNQANYQNPGSNFNQRNNQNQVFNQNQGHRNNFNQAPTYQAPTHQLQVVPQVSEFQAYMKANVVVMKNMQTQMTSLTNSNLELKNMFGQFIKMNTASTSGRSSLPSNTVPNPWEDIKVITTRSGVTLAEPSVSPSCSSKEVDREP